LFVLDGQGFGVGWLVNKLKKVSASRVPYIEKREDLVSLLQTFALQDVVFRLGQAERVDSSSVFKRDFLKIKKDLIYNEYVKFLLSQISIPDSLTVAQKYNNSILSGMFIEPKRVVFSEIRVFDLAVAEDLNKKILSGQPFDYLLKQYGGSIKEPLSLGKNNPLTLEAFNLEVGSVSSIIKNNNGCFSIIRVESFLAETPFSLNRVYSQLERDLIVKKQEEIKENLFNFLVEKLGVSINFNVLGL